MELAQQCFLDALDQNIGDTAAWTNLGVTLHAKGPTSWPLRLFKSVLRSSRMTPMPVSI